jgi:hypothetical protein
MCYTCHIANFPNTPEGNQRLLADLALLEKKIQEEQVENFTDITLYNLNLAITLNDSVCASAARRVIRKWAWLSIKRSCIIL